MGYIETCRQIISNQHPSLSSSNVPPIKLHWKIRSIFRSFRPPQLKQLPVIANKPQPSTIDLRPARWIQQAKRNYDSPSSFVALD